METLPLKVWHRGPVEAALRLDATALLRNLRREHPEVWKRSRVASGPLELPVLAPLTRNGCPAGEIAVVVALDGGHGVVTFPDGAEAILTRVPTNLSGVRWWWVCPAAGRNCAALYQPNGAERFLSRAAHGLTYSALREGRAARSARRARALRQRLGEQPPALGGILPGKPPKMHTTTYARMCDAIREAEQRAFSGRLGRVLEVAP